MNFFLTQYNDPTNSKSYLWSLLPRDSVVISETIIPYLPQITDFNTFLPDTNGKTMYLDLSENPENIDTNHFQSLLSQLKSVRPIKVLINEYKMFYQPQEDFIYYPAFFFAYSNGTYLNNRAPVHFPTFEPKTKGFMSLNNRAVWHRIWLFTELAKNNLLDKVEYSFVWDPKTNPKHQMDLLPEDRQQLAKSLFYNLPIRFANEKHLEFNADVLLGPDCHKTCAVNIVTESAPNLGFLTEKICKPLACYQIPILLSHKGATQFCVDLGFDMFEDIIPWKTWDQIDDEQQRCAAICKFIVEYIKYGDPLSDWNRCQGRVIANKQYLVGNKFKKRCLSQF